MDYLTFPILLKIQYGKKSITPYLLIGPRIDVRLQYKHAAKITGEAHPWEGLPLDEWNIIDDFEKFIFGSTIGFGLEFNILKKSRITIDLRLDNDYTYAHKNEHLKIKNEAYEVIIGFDLN